PLVRFGPSAILWGISVSTCSGAAPGWTVVITIVGMSTFGKRSTPSFVNENAPMTVSERISTGAKTGRLTQRAANHCMTTPLLLNFDSVGELADVGRRHALAGLQASGDFNEIADRVASGHDSFLHVVSVDHIDATSAGARRHGGGRYEHARRALR